MDKDRLSLTGKSPEPGYSHGSVLGRQKLKDEPVPSRDSDNDESEEGPSSNFEEIVEVADRLMIRNMRAVTGVTSATHMPETLEPEEIEYMSLVKQVLSLLDDFDHTGVWPDLTNAGMVAAAVRTELLNRPTSGNEDPLSQREPTILPLLLRNQNFEAILEKYQNSVRSKETTLLTKSFRNEQANKELRDLIAHIEKLEASRRQSFMDGLTPHQRNEFKALTDTNYIKKMTVSGIAELILAMTARPELGFYKSDKWQAICDELETQVTTKPDTAI